MSNSKPKHAPSFSVEAGKKAQHLTAVKAVPCHGAVTVIFIDFKLFWQQQ